MEQTIAHLTQDMKLLALTLPPSLSHIQNSITLMTWTVDMHTNLVQNIINSSSRMITNVVALLHKYLR